MITQDTLKKHIHYDPVTGIITRLTSAGPSKSGSLLKSKDITIDGFRTTALKFIWLYMYGHIPNCNIIRLDGTKSNVLSNLILSEDINKIPFTQQNVKRFLNYDPVTGIFTWKLTTNSSIKPGSIAGTVQGTLPDAGYLTIALFGKTYRAHRLAWFITYGYMPKEIDHIDHNRLNNALNNLRDVSTEANSKNKKLYSNNKSGYHGITKRGNKWKVTIGGLTNRVYLGIFDTLQEAIAAKKAAETLNNYHNNHGM